MIEIKSCLNKVSDWQFLGEVSASDESITSRINQASLVNEISEKEKSVMLAMGTQLVALVAGLGLADIYRKARKIQADLDNADPTNFSPKIQDDGGLQKRCDNCGMALSGHSGHMGEGGFFCDGCWSGFGYGIVANKIAEVQPGEIDILIYGLNELTEPLANTGDEDLIMIQKLLSDFLQNLKTELQTSSQDQGNYEHSDSEKTNPGQGTEPENKSQKDHSTSGVG